MIRYATWQASALLNLGTAEEAVLGGPPIKAPEVTTPEDVLQSQGASVEIIYSYLDSNGIQTELASVESTEIPTVTGWELTFISKSEAEAIISSTFVEVPAPPGRIIAEDMKPITLSDLLAKLV